MTTVNLKAELHKSIDEIDNFETLEDIRIIIDQLIKVPSMDFWDELSEEEKSEIDRALIESEDEKNLIPHDQVIKELKKWRTK